MSDLNVAMTVSNIVGIEKESPIQVQEKNNIADATLLKRELEANVIEEEASQLNPDEVTETIDEMNSFLQSMNRNLSFTVDEQLGQSVIVVKDSESDEVIRQIPSEELVVLRKKMDDVVGILFDTKV
jgi:flagellar protein FlaG